MGKRAAAGIRGKTENNETLAELHFTYDASGIRRTKTVGTGNDAATHTYLYSGSTLLQETWGSNVLNFSYTPEGTPFSVRYSTDSGSSFTTYYYLTNLQGDITALLDGTGAVVARYTYDPWGELQSVTDADGTVITSTTHIANLNPLRYRGYYYDTETGWYYLQSRYYTPAVGRFLNADAFASTGQGFLGYNMFAYCGNDPVRHFDIMRYAEGKEYFSSGKAPVTTGTKGAQGTEYSEKIRIRQE